MYTQPCQKLMFTEPCKKLMFTQPCQKLIFTQPCHKLMFTQPFQKLMFTQPYHKLMCTQSCHKLMSHIPVTNWCHTVLSNTDVYITLQKHVYTILSKSDVYSYITLQKHVYTAPSKTDVYWCKLRHLWWSVTKQGRSGMGTLEGHILNGDTFCLGNVSSQIMLQLGGLRYTVQN